MRLLPVGLALLAIGVILLIFGISSSQSFSSDVSNFFTGKPTDNAMWLIVGGAAAFIAGVATIGIGPRLAKK